MEIYVGENIRRLRKERSLTQENLAEILQISPQSVSKWERGEAYPDITMLPAIANCFGVTIDVLLGNDKILTEEQIQKHIAEYKRMTAEMGWELRETILDCAKKAYREFSYDFRIMMMYVNALNIYGTDPDRKEEITRICKLVLQNCEDRTLCTDASSYICGLTSAEDRLAFLEKYIEYGQDWNWFKVYPYSTEEGKILMQHEIADKWWHLNMYIYTYANVYNDPTYTISHEDKIRLIRKCEAIFYAFFDEDDLGEYTFYVGQYNELLAQEYAAIGKIDDALTCFEKSVDGWIAYDSLPKEYTYKNILIDRRPYVWESLAIDDGRDLEFFRNQIDGNPVYDILRGESRFKKAYEKLTSCKR